MTGQTTDPYRWGYEVTRMGIDPACYSDDGMRESYDRGVAFAVAARGTGYILEAWPAGQTKPPSRASYAFRKACQVTEPRDKVTWAPSGG